MEFESFESDIRKLLKDHKDCTKKLKMVKDKASEDVLEPFHSSTNE